MRPLAALTALICAALLHGQATPRPATFSLPNGLRVILLEDHERPLVRARLHLPLDRAAIPARPGFGPLALRLLERSDAGNRTSEDFQQILASAGIELTPAFRAEGLVWDLVARSRDQDLALGLLADRVLRTVFDPATLEVQRLACWRDVEAAASTPRERLLQALEPDWTLQIPTMEGLTAITYEDLLGFYTRLCRPDHAVLILHGDLGREQARRLVFQTFGTWTAPPPLPTPRPAPLPGARRIQLPAAGTPAQVLALAPPPVDLGPEARVLVALLLPGDPILSPARAWLEGPNLVASLEATEPAAAGLEDRLAGRLQALRQRGFTAADLTRARSAWSAGLPLTALHPEAQMDQALAETLGGALSQTRMEAFTIQALNDALRRWLDPARLRIGQLADPSR